MPCYEVRLVTVKFKVKHKNILEQAAKELQWAYRDAGRFVNVGTIQIDMERGEAVTSSYQQDAVNRLKVKYSEVALKTAARKKNWKLFKQPQKQNAYVLQKF